MTKFGNSLSAVLLLASLFAYQGYTYADTPVVERDLTKKVLGPRQLMDLLREPIDSAELTSSVAFSRALSILQDQLKGKGYEISFVADVAAFKDDQPDRPDPWAYDVKLPPLPKRPSLGQALSQLVGQLPYTRPTFFINKDHFEITTMAGATFHRLERRLDLRFENRTVHGALEDLFNETGLAVVLDARVAYRARTTFSANFTNGATIGSSLRVILLMADLDFVVLNQVIFATTPREAERLRYLQNLVTKMDSSPTFQLAPAAE